MVVGCAYCITLFTTALENKNYYSHCKEGMSKDGLHSKGSSQDLKGA